MSSLRAPRPNTPAVLVATSLIAMFTASSAFLALALGLSVSRSAIADTTTLTVADASQGTGIAPVTMLFPVTRSGDTNYDAILNYHTMDGTALAGTDYTATTGGVVIPMGATAATIPVTIGAQTGNGPNLSFQMLLDSTTGIGPAATFATQQTFGTGTTPFFVITSDVNGDGKPDLIVANFTDNTISVLLNTTLTGSVPSFATQQTFATGTHPTSVTVADVNGDGKPDLIVTNLGDNTVSVLLNTTKIAAGTLSFSTQQTFATGSFPAYVTTADLNGDGKPDLIVANQSDNTVSVLLNTTVPGAATPSFAVQQTFATGATPIAVTAADVNSDGKPDLIVVNLNGNSVSVLLNTTAPGASTPSFAAQQAFATGSGPQSVAAADLNGDGKLDLIVPNNNDNTVSVLLNTTASGAATPSFAVQQTFATGAGPIAVTATDLNGDGKRDLIVANYGGTVSVLLNSTATGAGTLSFAAQQTFATGSGSQSVTTADLNGNGKPDLIVANSNANTVSVLRNTATSPTAAAGFAAQQTFATGTSPGAVIAADINNDGKPDLIVANIGSTGSTVSVLLNTTAPGAVVPSFAAKQTFATGPNHDGVATADINGDGEPDLIVANSGTPTVPGSTVSVLLNTTAPGATTPSFTTQQAFATGSGPVSVRIADVNGDGKPDLIVVNAVDGTVSVLLNTTTPGATTPSFATQQTFATGGNPSSVAVVDVNGDGKPDLIVANSADFTVSVLLNKSVPGTLSFTTQQTFATGLTPTAVIAADINGDGKPDLIVVNQSDSTVSVLLNTTAPGAVVPSFAGQQTFATGFAPRSITAADVDGDGRLDLIVTNSGDSTFKGNTVSVLLNATNPGTAAVRFLAQKTFFTGLQPIAVTATDVNGDGKPDLIVTNSFSNTVSVLLNTQYQAVFAGSPAIGTIVHDYIFANGFE